MKQRNAGRIEILLACSLLLFALSGCGSEKGRTGEITGQTSMTEAASDTDEWYGMVVEEKTENTYATEFRLERMSEGYRRIIIHGQDYLVVPEGGSVPEGLPAEVTVIRRSSGKLYVASSSAMSFFQALSALDRVGYTSTRASDWAEDEIRRKVESEEITYVGKYNAPDYEWLMQEEASLAVENTMLLHSPKTKEQLEQLGIPVLVEYSSYEKHPMGRLEWVRVYGCILGLEEEADRYFDAEDRKFRELSREVPDQKERPGVAYFYFNPNGYVSVQRPGSYVAEMIRLAGGDYFLPTDNEEESTGGSVNLQTDSFYEKAKDAEILIYNGAIYGPPESLAKLTEEYPLLKDFKAVQNGRVYATGDNLFQGVTHMNAVLEELIRLVQGQEPEGRYFRRLP